jgi:hypothetical protein
MRWLHARSAQLAPKRATPAVCTVLLFAFAAALVSPATADDGGLTEDALNLAVDRVNALVSLALCSSLSRAHCRVVVHLAIAQDLLGDGDTLSLTTVADPCQVTAQLIPTVQSLIAMNVTAVVGPSCSGPFAVRTLAPA